MLFTLPNTSNIHIGVSETTTTVRVEAQATHQSPKQGGNYMRLPESPRHLTTSTHDAKRKVWYTHINLRSTHVLAKNVQNQINSLVFASHKLVSTNIRAQKCQYVHMISRTHKRLM